MNTWTRFRNWLYPLWLVELFIDGNFVKKRLIRRLRFRERYSLKDAGFPISSVSPGKAAHIAATWTQINNPKDSRFTTEMTLKKLR